MLASWRYGSLEDPNGDLKAMEIMRDPLDADGPRSDDPRQAGLYARRSIASTVMSGSRLLGATPCKRPSTGSGDPHASALTQVDREDALKIEGSEWVLRAGLPVLGRRLHASSGSVQPTITIITPSFNQARFIERITPVLYLGYDKPNTCCGGRGSTDGSVEIILRYEDDLAGRSGPTGQTEAINKGCDERRATLSLASTATTTTSRAHSRRWYCSIEPTRADRGACRYIFEDGSLMR